MHDEDVVVESRARWEAVYRAEAPRLWRSLLLVTGDPELASDVMAEAFAQGIAREDAVRRPGAWVWKAAFAIAVGELKRMRRSIEPAVVPDGPAPESVIDLTRLLIGASTSRFDRLRDRA